jgi:hypothetical protein
MMLAALLGLAMAPQQVVLPREVRAYVARRDDCDHFRGEASSDEQRQSEIDAETLRLCRGSDAQLARLKRKYARNRVVQHALADYDPRIED